MEGRRHCPAVWVVAGAFAIVGYIGIEAAEAQRRAVTAESDDHGFSLDFIRETDGRASAPTQASESSCTWAAVRYSESTWAPAESQVGAPPSADHELWQVFCDGIYRGTVWLGPSDFGAPDVQPVVERLTRQILVDGVRVASRPEGEGITGIPSLFWVEGYDGAPISRTEEAFGLSVTVTAQLREVVWDFGDGTGPVRAGLGEAWPERSSVRHTYADRSPPGAPYVVTASLVLDASFSVDGQPATALPSLTRLGELAVTVEEIQAVRNR